MKLLIGNEAIQLPELNGKEYIGGYFRKESDGKLSIHLTTQSIDGDIEEHCLRLDSLTSNTWLNQDKSITFVVD